MHFIMSALVLATVLTSGKRDVETSRTPILVPGVAPAATAPPAEDTDAGFMWQLQGSFAQSVFTDLSMADESTGFACAELGVLYKTTNAGTNWTRIVNLGFPYYWYGVAALSRQKVVVSGFNNTTGDGIYRWSFDGGANWDSIVALDTAHWLSRARFADSLRGIIAAGWTGGIWRTDNGGRRPEDWTYVQVDPASGWFEGNFCFRPDSSCFLAGISFCRSNDNGRNWQTQHSADPVFDGGVWFSDSLHGWTGGGQISSPVKGWVHRTTDGGANWSDRLIETPAPVRAVLFLNDTLGFAAGGNLYSGDGFIYSTVDGGDSWVLDVNTGSEMKGIDYRVVGDSIDVWCAGFNSSFTGSIYKTRIAAQGVGLAEVRPLGSTDLARPTILHRLPPSAVAFDATGRRVLNPKPGVYFVREEPQAASLRPLATQKILIQP
jgi:photosystem II stability/assembly factor-like uncharacterized protein